MKVIISTNTMVMAMICHNIIFGLKGNLHITNDMEGTRLSRIVNVGMEKQLPEYFLILIQFIITSTISYLPLDENVVEIGNRKQ